MKNKETKNKAMGNVELKKRRRTLYELFFKRFFDFIFSLLLIIITSPIVILLLIFSAISTKANPILGQYRPGKNGKLFKFRKIKSMKDIYDEKGELLPDAQRITKFGKFIRKTSLDELLQLFNILKGDMSFVGPRPRLVEDMIFYDEEVMKGYTVRPGVTGPDQIIGGRSSASWEDIFEADVKYAEHITFWGDVKILFKTIGCLFKSDSSEGGAETSKRDYYYRDYQLKTGKITKEQYALGMARAHQLKTTGGVISFQPDLHNVPVSEEQTE